MKTNLQGSGSQQLIIDYIEANASEALIEKINRCGKTMADCWQYIRSQAQKREKNGCAMIEDREVFGWAIHYFEEEGNVQNEKTDLKQTAIRSRDLPTREEPKPSRSEAGQRQAPAKPKKEKGEEMLPGQLTISELFGDLT